MNVCYVLDWVDISLLHLIEKHNFFHPQDPKSEGDECQSSFVVEIFIKQNKECWSFMIHWQIDQKRS